MIDLNYFYFNVVKVYAKFRSALLLDYFNF